MEINNHNSIGKVNFTGISPKVNQPKNMEELVMDTITELLNRAEREVPQDNSFSVVKETLKNPDKTSYATEIDLLIAPDDEIKNQRKLQLVAHSNYDLKGTKTLKLGTKDEILGLLKNKEFCQKILKQLDELIKDLKDGVRGIRRD